MRDSEKTIGNIIDKQKQHTYPQLTSKGFPIQRQCLHLASMKV